MRITECWEPENFRVTTVWSRGLHKKIRRNPEADPGFWARIKPLRFWGFFGEISFHRTPSAEQTFLCWWFFFFQICTRIHQLSSQQVSQRLSLNPMACQWRVTQARLLNNVNHKLCPNTPFFAMLKKEICPFRKLRGSAHSFTWIRCYKDIQSPWSLVSGWTAEVPQASSIVGVYFTQTGQIPDARHQCVECNFQQSCISRFSVRILPKNNALQNPGAKK